MNCPVCGVTIEIGKEMSKLRHTHKGGRTPRLVTYQGRQQTVREWCCELSLNRQQLYRRMKKEAVNERQ